MNEANLVLRVTLHAPAFHGVPDWPPSPARVFQALVAGAAHHLDDVRTRTALEWMEVQPPPIIAVPPGKLGQAVTMYVPNNDLDAKGGDPAKIGEIRVAKQVQARHLDHPDLLFIWRGIDPAQAAHVLPLAAGLYQLGRGVDMAFARAEILDDASVEIILGDWRGTVHHPTPGAVGDGLACPRPGSLASLRARHAGFLQRFGRVGKGRNAIDVFAQPPRPFFAQVPYDANVQQALFEVRRADDPGRFAPSALSQAVTVVTAWRDAAARRLIEVGIPEADVHATLIGKRPGDGQSGSTVTRVRIIPLPSIGHEHADQRIRRLLVEVPVGGPLGFEDVRWAFSGLVDGPSILVESHDRTMLDKHYRVEATTFVSVTPLALPATRRRIEPSRQAEEAKAAAERAKEEAEAVHAVRQALRHAGIRAPVAAIEVQREPWDAHGERAEACALLPRFAKERLWHVRLRFRSVERGPIAIGDGRFVGLGLMRPEASTEPDRFSFQIAGGLEGPIDPHALARHTRRAVMARMQEVLGKASLPKWLSGHEEDGRPASGHHHLTVMVDIPRERIIVQRPTFPRFNRDGRTHAVKFSQAMADFRELRAGDMGVLSLSAMAIAEDDPVFATSAIWRSVTPYRVERHRRADSANAAVTADLMAAIDRAGLPPADIEVASVASVSGGVEARHVVLRFSRPVRGPLTLGRTRHLGGGLFEAADVTSSD